MARFTLAPVLALSAVILAACVGFGDYQSARLAGPGNTQLTPAAAVTWFDSGDQTERASHHLGIRVTRGVSPGFDLLGGVEYAGTKEAGRARWVIGAGPKVSVVQDRLALWVPIGALFGEGVQTGRTWQTNPTLLLTVDAAPELEVTPSIKALVPLHPERRGEYLLVLNLGLGWTPPGGAWTLRPEGGIIWDPDAAGDGRVWHFGMGATIPLRR
jgi:hypothetical protein